MPANQYLCFKEISKMTLKSKISLTIFRFYTTISGLYAQQAGQCCPTFSNQHPRTIRSATSSLQKSQREQGILPPFKLDLSELTKKQENWKERPK